MIRFIKVEYLFKTTTIDKNVDVELLKNSIYAAQVVRIQPIIGNELYTKLYNDVENNTVSGIYVDVLEKIAIPLAYWTHYEAIPDLKWKYTNKSVVSKTGENTTTSDLDEVRYIRSTVREKAEAMTNQLVNWLEQNKGSIPEYGDKWDKGSAFFSGLYLGSDIKSIDKYNKSNKKDF